MMEIELHWRQCYSSWMLWLRFYQPYLYLFYYIILAWFGLIHSCTNIWNRTCTLASLNIWRTRSWFLLGPMPQQLTLNFFWNFVAHYDILASYFRQMRFDPCNLSSMYLLTKIAFKLSLEISSILWKPISCFDHFLILRVTSKWTYLLS